MSKLRTIMLVGRDPYALRNALLNSGFNHSNGFQLVEAGGVDAANRELRSDDSIVALATCDPDLHRDVIALADTRRLVRAVSDAAKGPTVIPEILLQQLELEPAL